MILFQLQYREDRIFLIHPLHPLCLDQASNYDKEILKQETRQYR